MNQSPSRATGQHAPEVAVMIFVSIWIDKGAGMMTGGLNPSVFGRFTHYFPSWVEIVMGIGLYALGALIVTVLFKIAIAVQKESGITTAA